MDEVSTQAEDPELWEQLLRTGRSGHMRWSPWSHTGLSPALQECLQLSSSRTWRSQWKLVKVIPFRFRPFSWQMFQHWDRWVKSDSVSRQLSMRCCTRRSSGIWRGKRKQVMRLENQSDKLSPLLRDKCLAWSQACYYHLIKLNTQNVQSDFTLSLTLFCDWIKLKNLENSFSSYVKQNTTYSASLGAWMKIMECTRNAQRRAWDSHHQVNTTEFSAGRWDKYVQIPSVDAWAPDACISGQAKHLEDM